MFCYLTENINKVIDFKYCTLIREILFYILIICVVDAVNAGEIFHSGPTLEIQVKRGSTELPIYKINRLKKDDLLTVIVDPELIKDSKWLLVVAQINPSGSKVEQQVFDLSQKDLKVKINILDDEFKPVFVLAPQLRNLFGLYTSVDGSYELISDAISSDPQKFLELQKIDQLSQAILAISIGLDSLLETEEASKNSIEFIKSLVKKFGLKEINPNCIKSWYIDTQCVATDIINNKDMVLPSPNELTGLVGKNNTVSLTSLLTQNLHIFSVATDFFTNKYRDQYVFAPSFARHKLSSESVELFSLNRFQNGNIKTAYIYVPSWSDNLAPKIKLKNLSTMCLFSKEIDITLEGKSSPADFWHGWRINLSNSEKSYLLNNIKFNFYKSRIILDLSREITVNSKVPYIGNIDYFYGFDLYKIEGINFSPPLSMDDLTLNGLDSFISGEKAKLILNTTSDFSCLNKIKLIQDGNEHSLNADQKIKNTFNVDLKEVHPGSAIIEIDQINVKAIQFNINIQEKKSKNISIFHYELEQDIYVSGDNLERIKNIQLGNSLCLPDILQEDQLGNSSLIFKCSDYIMENINLPEEVLINYLNNEPKSEKVSLSKVVAKPKFNLVNSENNPILVFLSKNAEAWGLKQDDFIVSDDSGINLTFSSYGSYKLTNGPYFLEIKFQDDRLTEKTPIQFALIADKKTGELKTRSPISFSSANLPSMNNYLFYRIKDSENNLYGSWSELKKSIIQTPILDQITCDAVNKNILVKGKRFNLIQWSSESDSVNNPKNKVTISKMLNPCDGEQCLLIEGKSNINKIFFKFNWIDDRLFAFDISEKFKKCLSE